MTTQLIPIEIIENKIFVIRGHRVMLDSDLAQLYGVETGALNRAGKRNSERFPEDFMFQLATKEWENLKCQIGISSGEYGGRRYNPYVFTEQGVAMLSSVLNSKQAIAVNVQIMRVFVKLRQVVLDYKNIPQRLSEIEKLLMLYMEKMMKNRSSMTSKLFKLLKH